MNESQTMTQNTNNSGICITREGVKDFASLCETNPKIVGNGCMAIAGTLFIFGLLLRNS